MATRITHSDCEDHHRVVQEPELPRVLRPPYRRWTRLDPFLLVRGAAPGRTHGGREVRPAAFSASQHAARLRQTACQQFSWSASCFRLLSNVRSAVGRYRCESL